MKNFIGILLLLVISISCLSAQEKINAAVMFDAQKLNDNYLVILKDSMITKLNRSKRMTFDYFTYDESVSEVEMLVGGKLGFSKKMMVIEPSIYYEKKPTIEISYDKETKKSTGSIKKEFKVDFYVKTIDIATSKVDDISQFAFNFQKLEVTDKYFTFDMAKFQKGAIPKKGSKAYNEMIKRVYKVYLPKMKEFRDRCIYKEQKVVRDAKASILASADDRLFEISPVDGKKGMGSFMIDAGVNDDVFWLDNVRVIKQVQIGEYTAGEYLGTAVVKKRLIDESKCGFLLLGGKKLKNAVENNEKVYAARDRSLINTLNTVKFKKIRVATDAECLFCNVESEKLISNLDNVTLIERSHGFLLDYFIPKYKSEQFIDYDVENVLGLQEGAEYFIRSNGDIMSLTEIKTGRVTTLEKGTYANKVRQFLLESFEQEIEVLQVSKRKKEVAKKLIIYSPYGFNKLDVIETFLITEETVGGKVYNRKEKIGTARVLKKFSDNIVEVSIGKNEKLITKTIDSGGKIGFGYFTGKK
ncbi:hypothetical protein N9B82_05260 [Saprospiraceae bacterium]|nr:hypothetical protein [Saprospiraceae bacterium]